VRLRDVINEAPPDNSLDVSDADVEAYAEVLSSGDSPKDVIEKEE
jgi:hypothetical protein